MFLLLTSVLLIGLTACGNKEPEYSLEFIEGKTVTIEDNEYVGAFFNFTNNGDETVMPTDAIDVKAFQNGTELNRTEHCCLYGKRDRRSYSM